MSTDAQAGTQAGSRSGTPAGTPTGTAARARAGTRGPRLLLALGLLVGLAGFVYDWSWHARNLAPLPIGPGTLLRVHSGIYLGQAIVLGVALWAAHSRVFGHGWLRAGQMILLAGAVLELFGNAGDFWSHSRLWESPVFHQSMYTGLAIAVAGYLVLELASAARPGVPAGAGPGR